MRFRDFDIDLFLRDHWQKKPLLIRDAFENWIDPIEPDELAGLACEEGVEARLVMQEDNGWQVEHGPFADSRFGRLGPAPWSLLVQAVDHHVPDVAALIAPFRFVPNWRIDDVMVSCASDGGGVGAHVDQYDVFLIQGLGRRRWQIAAPCGRNAAMVPHDDLRLLAAFETSEEWLLEPGDMLYLPPGVPHNGVAVGDDCMTYSVGFRAPSRSELIAHYCDHLLAELGEDDRYADPDLRRQDNPGEIAPRAIADLHVMIAEQLLNREVFARWFGAYSTTPKYADADWRPDAKIGVADVKRMISKSAPLVRNPASRFAFTRVGDDALTLFVDGASFECVGAAARLAGRLAADDAIPVGSDLVNSEQAVALIAALVDQGSIAFDEEA